MNIYRTGKSSPFFLCGKLDLLADWRKIWQAEKSAENLADPVKRKIWRKIWKTRRGKSAENFRSMENLENLRILYGCGKSAEKSIDWKICGESGKSGKSSGKSGLTGKSGM